jgi:hypothetical protein
VSLSVNIACARIGGFVEYYSNAVDKHINGQGESSQ